MRSFAAVKKIRGRPVRSLAGGEIAEAPPAAEKARRFRGSAPIGGHDSGRESVGTTVGKRAPPLRTPWKHTAPGGQGRPPLQLERQVYWLLLLDGNEYTIPKWQVLPLVEALRSGTLGA